ncbi:MAG: MarR family transcriptional regulator [Desulfobacterales bacterium]|nr:MarR family transcriptional regulator [Desulfobacterales bacterium]MCP4158772.1 MarR family transcriptional regulator [Deltaproteobacteria bacterium]
MKEIDQKLKSVFKLAMKLDKTPRSYGTEELFTSAEIHLVETIGDNDEKLGVTDLAKFLSITKGAVSQTLKKLEKKGLTIKTEDLNNSSRLIVSLSSKGKVAYFAHKHWHETKDGGYKEYYENLPPDKVEFLVEFFTRVEGFYKKILSEE